MYLIKDIYQELGFVGEENEAILTKYTRSLIIEWACRSGVKNCVQDSFAMLINMINNSIAVPIDVQSAVYCGALKEFDTSSEIEVMKSLFNKVATSKDQNERDRVTNGMGCVSNETSLEFLLQESLNPSSVFRQDEITGVYLSVLKGQKNGASYVLKFLKTNYEQLFMAE